MSDNAKEVWLKALTVALWLGFWFFMVGGWIIEAFR